MLRLPLAALTAASLSLVPCLAQSVVVPNANATARGSSGLNTLTRNSGAPRTYMLGIDATQLAGVPVGSLINGLSFRSNITTSNPALWPPTDATWADFEISVGNAIPLASWTTTFASNFSSTPTAVRDGSMLITANSFSNQGTGLPAPTPNSWGEFYYDFQTPFLYLGGDLGLLFTHPGSNIATALFLDTVASSAANGFVAFSASTFQAATGASAAACIVRVHYGYGLGCPGSSGTSPNLVVEGDTTGGGNAVFAVANAPASQPVIYIFGFGRVSVPLFGTCNLFTLPSITAELGLDINGRSRLSLAIPAGVLGTLNVQAAVVDPASSTLVTLTNAVEFTAN